MRLRASRSQEFPVQKRQSRVKEALALAKQEEDVATRECEQLRASNPVAQLLGERIWSDLVTLRT